MALVGASGLADVDATVDALRDRGHATLSVDTGRMHGRDGRDRVACDEAGWLSAGFVADAFQAQWIVLLDLEARTCRAAIDLSSRSDAALLVRLPQRPLATAEQRTLARWRDPSHRFAWHLSHRPDLDAFQWAPHRLNPLLAASMIRLARAFVTHATEDRGSWLAADDPRIVETGDLAGAVHRLVSSPLPQTDPVRDQGRRARPPVTSGLGARLSRRLATPTADRLAASLAEPVHRALDRPDVPDRLVDEIQRLIDRVRSYERWSPRAWRRSWPRRPPPVAASPAADTRPAPASTHAAGHDATPFRLPPAEPGAGVRGPSQGPRILVVVPTLAVGGAEHVLFQALRALKTRFAFAVATLEPHGGRRGDRRAAFSRIVPVYALGDRVPSHDLDRALVALVRELAIDLVFQAVGSERFYACLPDLRRRLDRPLAVVDQLFDHQQGFTQRYAPGQPSDIDLCIAVSERIAQELTVHRGWPAHRVATIRVCGRRPDDLPPADERAALRRRTRQSLGWSPEEIVFLTAARLHPQKRPFDLVGLASRMRDESRARFVWVGGGPLEDDLDRTIRQLSGLRVERLPWRTDVPELILASDVGCLVSAYEGLPVFLLECLQLGVPFLAPDVGVVNDVLGHSGAGLVARRGSLRELESHARRLLVNSTRASMTAATRSAADAFSVEQCAEDHARAFERALALVDRRH